MTSSTNAAAVRSLISQSLFVLAEQRNRSNSCRTCRPTPDCTPASGRTTVPSTDADEPSFSLAIFSSTKRHTRMALKKQSVVVRLLIDRKNRLVRGTNLSVFSSVEKRNANSQNCPVCTKAYINGASLRRHIQTTHADFL